MVVCRPKHSVIESGYDGQAFVLPSAVTPMSTAIARIYTVEGFILATDGRETNPGEGIRSVQKMFSIEQPARKLSYILAGTTRILQDGKEVVFDFTTEVQTVAGTLAEKRIGSLYEYGQQLAYGLDVRLKEATKALSIATPDTHVFIDGYYGKHPKRIRIDFMHDRQNRTSPEVSSQELEHKWWGSRSVSGIVFDHGDPRLTGYKLGPAAQPRTLAEGVFMAQRYIGAHCDPEALKIDEEVCSGCGPPIWVAELTFAKGFRFVERPADC